MPLTKKKTEFVRYWNGSLNETLELMSENGVKLSLPQATRYKRDPDVINAIKNKSWQDVEVDYYAPEQKAVIATKAERQAFWTSVMKDNMQRMTDRLKASELLGKAFADFTDKIDMKASVKKLTDYIAELD